VSLSQCGQGLAAGRGVGLGWSLPEDPDRSRLLGFSAVYVD
jgi:hypothetical protein